MSLPSRINDLVQHFTQHIDSFKGSNYNETRARIEFIDPFFKELGWDIDNTQGFAEAYKDVIHEDAIKVEGSTKAPDYSFRIGGQWKFFLEAKKPSVNVKDDIAPAYQLRRYAWNAGLPVSVLTDFEEFAVYDTTIRPNAKDKASTARIFYCTFNEYAKHWEYITSIFSKDAILKGSFDHFVNSAKKKKGTTAVDKEFLKEMEKWRNDLAKNIALRNSTDIHSLNYVVQATIDRVLFLRICEDRNIEEYGRLQKVASTSNIYKQLIQIFEQADQKYNSGLFHFHKEKNISSAPDEISLTLKIDDKILKEIITALYYPSPYEFSVISADILGNVYEQFLGKVIRLTSGGQAKVEEKPEVKKAGGVYYTPQSVVKYIVENTIGEVLKNKTPMMISGKVKGHSPLRILDPACGSGSFLIYAYQYLLDWHRDWYEKDIKQKGHLQAKKWHEAVYQGPGNHWYLTTQEKKRILLNNIFGVDIDHQAVEVTKLNLLLKVLEGENRETLGTNLKLFQERALPDLSQNIKCGNSLIGNDFYGLQNKGQGGLFDLDDEAMYKINAFDWKTEFSATLNAGGFDAIIGNPPWGGSLDDAEKKYLSTKYKSYGGNFDNYIFFIEKSIDLLRPMGRFSFITPDTWLKIPQAQNARNLILSASAITEITTLPTRVFEGVSANSIVFQIEGKPLTSNCRINIMLPDSPLENLVNRTFQKQYDALVANWLEDPTKQFQIFQDVKVSKIMSKLRTSGEKLSQHLDVMQGIVPYSTESLTKEEVKARIYHSLKKKSNEYGPWVQGRAIRRFGVADNKTEFLKYGKWLHRPRKKKYFEGERILIQEITGGQPPRICAAIYAETLYHDPGIISCLRISEANIFALLGIINSKLMSFYHQYNSPKGIRAQFPKVLISDIRDFPLPKLLNTSGSKTKMLENLVQHVTNIMTLEEKVATGKYSPDEMNRLRRQIEATDTEIDKLVYELYDLTELEIKTIEDGYNHAK